MAAIVVDTMSEAKQSEIFTVMEQMGQYHRKSRTGISR
jgi:hypothetical protein